MPTLPYLHFDGTCAEALTFYATVLDGTNLQMMRYADAPDVPETMKSPRVMHGQVTIGDGTLMASDAPEGQGGAPQASVSVMQSAPDVATGARWFAALAEGGAVVAPYGPSFFSPGFGMVRDRFGTHWMIAATPAG